MNMTELSSHWCWQITCVAAVWPSGPADLGSSLCNARKLSCLVLILTISQSSVLTALKPVNAVYENIFSPMVSLEEYALESGYCKSRPAILRTARSLGTECLVSHLCRLPSVLKNVSSICCGQSVPSLPFPFFFSVSRLPATCPLWLYGVLPSSGEEPVTSCPNSFWNINLIDTDALLQTSD